MATPLQLIKQEKGSGNVIRYGMSITASVIISFLILLGIAQARKTEVAAEDTGMEELQAIVLPSPPPPPPPAQAQSKPLPPSLQTFDLAPTPDAVQVALAPNTIRPEITPPDVTVSFDFTPDAFKPTNHDYQTRKVFQKSEVDQPPIPIYKKVPGINLKLMGKHRYARTSLMYIVNTKGNVEAVTMVGSGGKWFDEVVIEGAKQWRFKPAVKDGKKVDCWVRQNVTVKTGGSSSPFSL